MEPCCFLVLQELNLFGLLLGGVLVFLVFGAWFCWMGGVNAPRIKASHCWRCLQPPSPLQTTFTFTCNKKLIYNGCTYINMFNIFWPTLREWKSKVILVTDSNSCVSELISVFFSPTCKVTSMLLQLYSATSWSSCSSWRGSCGRRGRRWEPSRPMSRFSSFSSSFLPKVILFSRTWRWRWNNKPSVSKVSRQRCRCGLNWDPRKRIKNCFGRQGFHSSQSELLCSEHLIHSQGWLYVRTMKASLLGKFASLLLLFSRLARFVDWIVQLGTFGGRVTPWSKKSPHSPGARVSFWTNWEGDVTITWHL